MLFSFIKPCEAEIYILHSWERNSGSGFPPSLAWIREAPVIARERVGDEGTIGEREWRYSAVNWQASLRNSGVGSGRGGRSLGFTREEVEKMNLDSIIIYASAGTPSLSCLASATFYPSYSKSNFGFVSAGA